MGNNDTGTYGDIFHSRAQLSFSPQPLLGFFDIVDVSSSFERYDICVLVPKRGDAPVFFNILRTFSRSSWLTFLLTVLVTVLIVRGFEITENRYIAGPIREHAYSMVEICTMVYQSTFGDTIMRMPTRVPLQTVIISWCVFTFLLASGFTAKVISSLVRNNRPLPDMNTVDALLDSRLRIYAARSTYEVLEQTQPRDTVLDRVTVRIHSIPNEKDFLRLIETEKYGNAYVLPKYLAKYMIHKHHNKLTDRSYYHLMDLCLLSLPEVYLAEIGSPYINYVNELLGRLQASGFHALWWKRSEFSHHLGGEEDAGDAEGDEEEIDESKIKVVITLDHMKAVFCLWALGIIIATLVFVIELVLFEFRAYKGRQVLIINAVVAKECGCIKD